LAVPELIMADRVPADLRRAVAESCTPVHPLADPVRRAWALAPCALLLGVIVMAVWGLRGDYREVGVWRLWGASSVQIVLAIAVAAAVAAESMPGRLRPMTAHLILAGAAVVLFLAATLLTNAASHTVVPAPFKAPYFWICLTHPLLLGLPALAVLGIMAGRGLTSRPLVSGALAGLSAGLVSDASWRLYCHVSDPGHVLVAHAGAIVALTAIGVAGGWMRRERSTSERA
jgi:hypothetical protein